MKSSSSTSSSRGDNQLEAHIAALLEDPQHEGHPLREALHDLFGRYSDQIAQLEKVTSISDGYQAVLQARNQSLAARYQKQVRQLEKIVRISDHYQNAMRELNEALRIASTQDPLTALPNRRLMMERLEAEAALTVRHQQVFSLAAIDIDHFKSINDKWGHDVGDQTLICIAHSISEGLRPYDICARWGGEEFMLLLPKTGGTQAFEVANRVRSIISDCCASTLPFDGQVSVSIGVAEHTLTSTLNETMKCADIALYEAKAAGRNKAVLAKR